MENRASVVAILTVLQEVLTSLLGHVTVELQIDGTHVGLQAHITFLLHPLVFDSTLVQDGMVHLEHSCKRCRCQGSTSHTGAPCCCIEFVCLLHHLFSLGVNILSHVGLVSLLQLLKS